MNSLCCDSCSWNLDLDTLKYRKCMIRCITLRRKWMSCEGLWMCVTVSLQIWEGIWMNGRRTWTRQKWKRMCPHASCKSKESKLKAWASRQQDQTEELSSAGQCTRTTCGTAWAASRAPTGAGGGLEAIHSRSRRTRESEGRIAGRATVVDFAWECGSKVKSNKTMQISPCPLLDLISRCDLTSFAQFCR